MTTEERLEVMERELVEMKAGMAVSRRRSRRLWIGLGLAGVACALAWGFMVITGIAQAKKTGDVIRANGFIVEDENGKTRAALAMLKDEPNMSEHDPGLRLFDENGKVRVELTLLRHKSPTLVLKDEPALLLYDEKTHRIMLAVLNENPGLVLQDKNGGVIWSAP